MKDINLSHPISDWRAVKELYEWFEGEPLFNNPQVRRTFKDGVWKYEKGLPSNAEFGGCPAYNRFETQFDEKFGTWLKPLKHLTWYQLRRIDSGSEEDAAQAGRILYSLYTRDKKFREHMRDPIVTYGYDEGNPLSVKLHSLVRQYDIVDNLKSTSAERLEAIRSFVPTF